MNTVVEPLSPLRTPAPALREWDLPVQGMTCASCATRVERTLAKLPGVAVASAHCSQAGSIQCAPHSRPIIGSTNGSDNAAASHSGQVGACSGAGDACSSSRWRAW